MSIVAVDGRRGRRPGPEMALLLRSVRGLLLRRMPEPGTAVGTMVGERLVDLARRHALVPVLDRYLRAAVEEPVPEATRCRLRELARDSQVRSVVLTEELKRLLKGLRREGVNALAYKGPALALQIHGDPKMRTFVDLDLLVTPAELARARLTAVSLGYLPRVPLHPLQERVLLRGGCDQTLVGPTGVVLELHWAVARPYMSFPLSTEELRLRARPLDLEGTPVAVPCPEDMVVLLAFSGVKDLWRSLEPLALLAALATRDGFDWDRVQSLARRLRAVRMVALACWLAFDLLDAPAPPGLRADIVDDAGLPPLAALARGRLLGDRPTHPEKLAGVVFRCRARERWSDRLRYVLLRAAMPTVEDGVALSLPPALWRLAGVVRPFRLAGLALSRISGRRRDGPRPLPS